MGSFRTFIEELQTQGEIKVLQEKINWDLECSAICGMSQRAGGPAVRFDNIKDYSGFSLLGSLFCGPGFFDFPQEARKMHGRMAIALGLDRWIDLQEIGETLLERNKSSIKAIEVESGPCQEVAIHGSDIDLLKYPFPRIHDKDGGRYINSLTAFVKDPETGWTVFSNDRLMLLDKNRLVHGTIPRRANPTPFEEVVKKTMEKGRALPFAIVIGPPPELTMASYMTLPPGSDNYGVAGALAANPLIVVKAKLSDILIPADAEMVIEGHIFPGEKSKEGPYAWVSYYINENENFVYRVEHITRRKDNLLIPFIAEGLKPSDTMCLYSLIHSVELLDAIRRWGFQLKFISIPVETKLCLAITSLLAKPMPGLPTLVAHGIFAHSPFIRKVVFVDPDVNAEDLAEALGIDMIYKSHPLRQWFISERDKLPGLTENHGFDGGLSSTMYIDATWRRGRDPVSIPRRVRFDVCFPKEVQEKVIKKWNEMGLSPKAPPAESLARW